MKNCFFRISAAGVLLAALATLAPADDAKEEAIKKDRALIAGTWRVVALEDDGDKATEEDTKNITVVNGADGSWTVSMDGEILGEGTSTIDPTQQPKTIDATETKAEGTAGLSLGIYEVGENTRRVCFAAPGKLRPTEFSTPKGSGHILVTLEREKAP